MTLRKTTIDDSVKEIPQSQQTEEKDCQPNAVKNNSILRKQSKKVSQNRKKNFCKNVS